MFTILSDIFQFCVLLFFTIIYKFHSDCLLWNGLFPRDRVIYKGCVHDYHNDNTITITIA